jgi:uncharacterized membrane protein
VSRAGMTGAPSAWRRRLPVVALALAGGGVATVLALFQLGVLGSVWEPFFGEGSRRVLTSSLSRALPVPDAALGVVAYLAEAVLEASGGRERWREHPWLVLATGAVAAGLGVTALGLIAAQVFLVGAFCTLCLVSAVISLLIVGLVVPEVRAAALRIGNG